ncbi:MAG: hypothetical protein AAB785_02460 [Patescibacteria group bacterium]
MFNIYDKEPTSAISLNLAIKKIKEIYANNKSEKKYFIIASKEVELQPENIDNLVEYIDSDKDVLVVGYKLKDNILTDKEYKTFSNDGGIAYQVPWNTCAIWDYKLFDKYIGEFDEICSNNQLGKLILVINGDVKYTGYKGMEDGLAISKALDKNSNLKYKLLKDELFWNIDGDDERKIDQKVKLARKNIVLSTFINIKGYSIEKLRSAAIEE